jgi:DNA-binding NarL/FixJ family response regulator
VREADDHLSRAATIARTVGPRHLVWRSAAAQARLWWRRDRAQHTRAMSAARQELMTLADAAGEADREVLLRSAEARQLLGRGDGRIASTNARLTGREQQVAEGVARGLRNKEIGAELGISSKTVEMHVANAIAKVRVSSRSALAVWIATDGPRDR